MEEELVRVLEEHVTAILRSYPRHRLPLADLMGAYTAVHGHDLRLADYGVQSVLELMEKIPHVTKVASSNKPYFCRMVSASEFIMHCDLALCIFFFFKCRSFSFF